MDWNKYFGDNNNFKKFDNDDTDDEDIYLDLDTFFNEFHGKKFKFNGFPPSILKQFQDIIKSMEDFDDNPGMKKRQEFFDKYSEFKQKSDQDLDGKIYTDQLESLLKNINPELMLKDSNNNFGNILKRDQALQKLTDEEKIMDIIHGTFKEEVVPPRQQKKRQVQKAPHSRPPYNFPFHELPPAAAPSNSMGSQSHTKTWGRTIISYRNADGSYETRKMERSPDGTTRTTITKTDADGKSSTQSFTGDERKDIAVNQASKDVQSTHHDERNLIQFNGYKIPCLW